MENKIDEFIRSRFPPNILAKLPHKEKRFALITILMNMLENPRSINEEQNKPYIPLWNQLKPTLEKMSTIWRQFTEKKLSLVALFADILAETTTLENST